MGDSTIIRREPFGGGVDMKMNISSKETHNRVHHYIFSEDELQRLALEKIASELGLDLAAVEISSESNFRSQSNGINPTTYSCHVSITERLDCKD